MMKKAILLITLLAAMPMLGAAANCKQEDQSKFATAKKIGKYALGAYALIQLNDLSRAFGYGYGPMANSCRACPGRLGELTGDKLREITVDHNKFITCIKKICGKLSYLF